MNRASSFANTLADELGYPVKWVVMEMHALMLETEAGRWAMIDDSDVADGLRGYGRVLVRTPHLASIVVFTKNHGTRFTIVDSRDPRARTWWGRLWASLRRQTD